MRVKGFNKIFLCIFKTWNKCDINVNFSYIEIHRCWYIDVCYFSLCTSLYVWSILTFINLFSLNRKREVFKHNDRTTSLRLPSSRIWTHAKECSEQTKHLSSLPSDEVHPSGTSLQTSYEQKSTPELENHQHRNINCCPTWNHKSKCAHVSTGYSPDIRFKILNR